MVGSGNHKSQRYEFKEGFLPVQYIVYVMEEAKEDYSRQEITNKYDVIKNAIPQDWIKRIENLEGKQEKDVYVKMGEKLYAFNEYTGAGHIIRIS